jgi:hypothetical protein
LQLSAVSEELELPATRYQQSGSHRRLVAGSWQLSLIAESGQLTARVSAVPE